MDDARNKLLEYTQTNAVDFIKGKKDINSDDDWVPGAKLRRSTITRSSGSCQPYADQYEIDPTAAQ